MKDTKDDRRKRAQIPSGDICPVRAALVDAILRGEKITQQNKTPTPKAYRLPSRAEISEGSDDSESEE
jgi:hypothetical protein